MQRYAGFKVRFGFVLADKFSANLVYHGDYNVK